MKLNTRLSPKGFTMVEILLVVALLAIIATAVMPKIYDYVGDAQDANMKGVQGALQSAIALYKSNDAYKNGGSGAAPAKLEAETFPTSAEGCDVNTKGCFDAVLDPAVVVRDPRWAATSTTSTKFTYTYYKEDARTNAVGTLVYDSADGSVVLP